MKTFGGAKRKDNGGAQQGQCSFSCGGAPGRRPELGCLNASVSTAYTAVGVKMLAALKWISMMFCLCILDGCSFHSCRFAVFSRIKSSRLVIHVDIICLGQPALVERR